VTAENDWTLDPYFEVPEQSSVDHGSTNIGPLWHVASQRWGHSMHTMCPYQGMFPPKIAHYFIQKYSSPGSMVLDPFSGRGTTVLQARVEGREAIGNDLSPLAFVLTSAKANPPPWDHMMRYIDELEKIYEAEGRREPDVGDEIRMLFASETLNQLWFLRERLLSSRMKQWTSRDFMMAGGIAGILHGATRSDGTSAFLSISMPNTFSMAPAYVRKYIHEHGLTPPEQNVFTRLREKLARLYADDPAGPACSAAHRDAASFMQEKALKSQIDLIVTSPPYMKVVNYGTSNWIRLWWLGLEGVSRQGGAGRRFLDDALDHGHSYEAYEQFIKHLLHGVRNCLKPNGVAAIVIGDVASPDGTAVALAERLWRELGSQSGLRMVEMIEDDLPSQQKVSRIWGETRGQATDRDCILVLTQERGRPIICDDIDWGEPYRDGGPDAAHQLLRGLVPRVTMTA